MANRAVFKPLFARTETARISTAKYKDLPELCKSKCIAPDYHAFYHMIRHCVKTFKHQTLKTILIRHFYGTAFYTFISLTDTFEAYKAHFSRCLNFLCSCIIFCYLLTLMKPTLHKAQSFTASSISINHTILFHVETLLKSTMLILVNVLNVIVIV